MLLALASAERASEIHSLDLRFLVKYSTGYIFQFRENFKTYKKGKTRNPIKYHFVENKRLCVCHHFDSYRERTKEYN